MTTPGNRHGDIPLSPDEIAILTHLVRGRSREATARRVQLSTRQIQRKVADIRMKLGADNDLQMAIIADRLGLIDQAVLQPGPVDNPTRLTSHQRGPLTRLVSNGLHP